MREALFGIFSLLFIAYFSELASSNIVFKPLSISLPDLPAKFVMVNPKGIKVLAVFVSKSAGEFLKDHAKGENGECCIYPPLNGKAWTVFAICFLSLVVIAAFLVIAFVAPRSLSNWRRRNLVRRVDSKVVEALPCFVFGSARSSIAGETCAICLEDYNDGELLKVLPCQHGRTFFAFGSISSLLYYIIAFEAIIMLPTKN
ncbi:hypothetical protein ERO13_D03G008600v2 [Gossypium hirsutum]|nr:hypothetical protein ERO13_D03G008600v2 [Gossypium hirsutum]